MPKVEAKLTSKGQITVPRKIRRQLRVRPGDRLVFEGEGPSVRVSAARKSSPFAKFRGAGGPDLPRGRRAIARWLRELRGR